MNMFSLSEADAYTYITISTKGQSIMAITNVIFLELYHVVQNRETCTVWRKGINSVCYTGSSRLCVMLGVYLGRRKETSTLIISPFMKVKRIESYSCSAESRSHTGT